MISTNWITKWTRKKNSLFRHILLHHRIFLIIFIMFSSPLELMTQRIPNKICQFPWLQMCLFIIFLMTWHFGKDIQIVAISERDEEFNFGSCFGPCHMPSQLHEACHPPSIFTLDYWSCPGSWAFRLETPKTPPQRTFNGGWRYTSVKKWHLLCRLYWYNLLLVKGRENIVGSMFHYYSLSLFFDVS